MKQSMPKRWRRPSACRRKTSRARTKRLWPNRSHGSRGTEAVRQRDFLEWPFFTPAHRELAQKVDAWAARRFGAAAAHGRQHHEDRASVDQTCRELVRDLGAAGWTRYSVPFVAEAPVAEFDVRALA